MEGFMAIFDSTAKAIQTEQLLIENNIDVLVRPVPPSIKSGCGISLWVQSVDFKKASVFFEKNASGIYSINNGNFEVYSEYGSEI